MKRKKLIILFFSLVFSVAFSQRKEQLQKQNAELKKQISDINTDLEKIQSQSKLSVAYLRGLDEKIGLREKVYSNTQKEKKFIEDDIYTRQLEINKYNRELATMRKNYAEILVRAYKNKGIQNKVTFILSSRNLGEALRRMQYLKQYGDYQDKKAAEITAKTIQVKNAIALREKSKQEKQNLLVSQEKDLKTINAERSQKQELLQEFKQNEAKLTVELRQKQAQSKQIEGEIRRIINEEIRAAKAKEEAERKAEAERIRLAKIAAEKEKARIDAENRRRLAEAAEAKRKAEAEAARAAELERKRNEEAKRRADEAATAAENERAAARKAAAERTAMEAAAKAKAAADKAAAARAAEASLVKKTEEAKKAVDERAMGSFSSGSASGSSFAMNRGHLMFPVASGKITGYFGRHQHEVFSNIVEENNGIKIRVAPGTKARAVFQGTVSSVIFTGDSKTVLIRHGEYFTVYENLSSVNVSKGQQVSAGTPVGTVAQDMDGVTTLDFQIWRGETPIDPMGWVSY